MLAHTIIHFLPQFSTGVVDHGHSVELVVDPGNSNIMNVQIYRDGSLEHTCRLTRNQYYQESGLNHSQERWKVWNIQPAMKALIDGRRINHFKTTYVERIGQSIVFHQANVDNNHILKLTPKKFERLKFFTNTKKKKTVHTFLSQLVRQSEEITLIMFYGNGQFAPGGKGQRSVPCKWVKQECKHYFTCYSVDEFWTSQICPECNDRLLDLRKHLRRNNKTGKKVLQPGCLQESSLQEQRWCQMHHHIPKDPSEFSSSDGSLTTRVGNWSSKVRFQVKVLNR